MATTSSPARHVQASANDLSEGDFVWSDIVFDIPLPKAQRKAALAAAASLDSEKGSDGGMEQVGGLAGGGGGAAPPPPPPLGDRRILSGVSGSVRHGQMMAILGASGAGKTTLLNILSARISSTGTLSGSVLFHNRPRDKGTWKRTVAFVEQDDIMLGYLTVYEQLYYSAKIRLPSKLYNGEAVRQRVEEILGMLRLEKCRDTRIGDAQTRGVSGGERKRTSIGVELVNDSSLLLLDEPTSGLDAFAAMSVIENVRNAARERNLACVMTIHQPSWALLNLFDRVQLLAQGKVYYDGPPRDSVAWFATLGYEVPEGANPVDYFITIAENPGKTEAGAQRVQTLINAWSIRLDEQKVKMVSEETPVTTSPLSSLPAGTGPVKDEELYQAVSREWPTPWLSELRVLTKRNMLSVTRDLLPLYASVGQTFILLIIIGFAFFRLGRSQSEVLARIGVLYYLPINTSFTVLFPVLAPLALQRVVMKRERSSGAYRTSSFLVAKILVDVPSNVLRILPFFVILYWMVGLKAQVGAYFIFLAVNSVQVVMAVCMGLLVGSLSPTIEIANVIAPLINVIFLLFGGNLLPSPPPWFIWLRWISPITYVYSALSQNEYVGQTFDCDVVDGNSSSSSSSQCYTTGDQVLTQYNLKTFSIGANIGFVAALAAICGFLAYLALRITAHPRFRYV